VSARASRSWIKQRFLNAIVAEARLSSLEAITVRSVCARAGLGRHTFFRMFTSLEDAKALVRQRHVALDGRTTDLYK
jgi:AcrR family transcriptional regulator